MRQQADAYHLSLSWRAAQRPGLGPRGCWRSELSIFYPRGLRPRRPVQRADGGPPDGAEAVVFVHGYPGPADDWRDLLIRVGELVRAIAPDMPGYGRDDKPTDFSYYTVDCYAGHLAAVLWAPRPWPDHPPARRRVRDPLATHRTWRPGLLFAHGARRPRGHANGDNVQESAPP